MKALNAPHRHACVFAFIRIYEWLRLLYNNVYIWLQILMTIHKCIHSPLLKHNDRSCTGGCCNILYDTQTILWLINTLCGARSLNKWSLQLPTVTSNLPGDHIMYPGGETCQTTPLILKCWGSSFVPGFVCFATLLTNQSTCCLSFLG